MARLTTIFIVLGSVILLFNLFGLSTETSLVHFLLYPESYASSDLYRELVRVIGIFVIAGGVSFFVSGSFKIDFLALAPMMYVFLTFFNELLSISNVLISGGTGGRIFGAFVVSPLYILLILGIIEWWRGVSA